MNFRTSYTFFISCLRIIQGQIRKTNGNYDIKFDGKHNLSLKCYVYKKNKCFIKHRTLCEKLVIAILLYHFSGTFSKTLIMQK